MSPTKCSECDKILDLIPLWLDEVDVKFTCEDCRQKHRSVTPTRSRKSVVVASHDDADDALEAIITDKADDAEISLEVLQEEEFMQNDDASKEDEETE